jgi:Peptidase family M20/M25/M40
MQTQARVLGYRIPSTGTVRKALRALGIATILLIAFALARTVASRPGSATVPAVPEVEIGEGAAERLAAAVRLRTIAHEDPAFDDASFQELHAHLQRSFPLVHTQLLRETVSEHSLLYTWQGSTRSGRPVLLMGHLDVVPIEPGTEQQWQEPPFSGRISDGFIWGRGAIDNKSTSAFCPATALKRSSTTFIGSCRTRASKFGKPVASSPSLRPYPARSPQSSACSSARFRRRCRARSWRPSRSGRHRCAPLRPAQRKHLPLPSAATRPERHGSHPRGERTDRPPRVRDRDPILSEPVAQPRSERLRKRDALQRQARSAGTAAMPARWPSSPEPSTNASRSRSHRSQAAAASTPGEPRKTSPSARALPGTLNST